MILYSLKFYMTSLAIAIAHTSLALYTQHCGITIAQETELHNYIDLLYRTVSSLCPDLHYRNIAVIQLNCNAMNTESSNFMQKQSFVADLQCNYTVCLYIVDTSNQLARYSYKGIVSHTYFNCMQTRVKLKVSRGIQNYLASHRSNKKLNGQETEN